MKKILYSFILISLTLSMQAQQKMSLEDCRQLALQQSEEVKIASQQIEKAKQEKAAMKTQYLPSLSGDVTGVYINKSFKEDLYLPTVTPDLTTGELTPNVMVNPLTGDPITDSDGNPIFNMYAWLPLEISVKGAYMAGVNIQQPIYTGGKIITANEMAATGIDLAYENKNLQETNSIYEADQAYWLYVAVKEKVNLASSYKKLLENLVETVTNSFDAGMITKNEVLKANVKLNDAKLQLQKAQSGLELSRMALCRITGLDYNTQIIATDSIINIDDGIIIKNENLDISNRPDYNLLKKQVVLANQKIKLSKADFLPTAGIQLGYNYIGGVKISDSNYTSNNLTVLATLKIPIYHWGEGKYKNQSAKIDADIKQLELDKYSRLMQLEIEQAKLNLKDGSTRVKMSEEALVQAEENLKESNDNYELGMEILPNLLEAQTQWQQAYSEIIDAKADYKLKESALLKAYGILK